MVKRYPGLSDLQSGIEPNKFVLAADYDALINLTVSYLGQIYGLIEEGRTDDATELCRAAAQSLIQEIADIAPRHQTPENTADSADDGMGSSVGRAPSRGTASADAEARDGLEVAGSSPAPCRTSATELAVPSGSLMGGCRCGSDGSPYAPCVCGGAAATVDEVQK